MSLLASRTANRATILLVLAIFAVLFLAPVPSSIQKRIGVIGASTVWAGSPDETLNPPPTPPKRSAHYTSPYGKRGVTARVLFSMFWRAYWTTVRL
jgi:hypothetical protein